MLNPDCNGTVSDLHSIPKATLWTQTAPNISLSGWGKKDALLKQIFQLLLSYNVCSPQFYKFAADNICPTGQIQ